MEGNHTVRLAKPTGRPIQLRYFCPIERREVRISTGTRDEVEALRQRPGLSGQSSSMRAVGYRQIWSHLDGEYDRASAQEKALAATRQLAKRQLTWLRSDEQLNRFDPLEGTAFDAISAFLDDHLG